MNEIKPITGRKEDGSRRVEGGRGLAWLTEGWALFMKNPGAWVVIALTLLIIYGLLAIVPVLGQIASQLLAPIFAAGLLLGCRSLDNGGSIRVEHLFAGFSQNTGGLVMVGVIYILGMLVAMLAAMLLGGGMGAMGAMMAPGGFSAMAAAGVFGSVLLGLLIFMVLIIPLLMAFWFAPALVLFRDMDATAAMAASFSACLTNTVPFLLYGLFAFVLLALAVIPAGLGLLVAIPILAGSSYASYVDIFE